MIQKLKKAFNWKTMLIFSVVLSLIVLVLVVKIQSRGLTTYSKDGFQISYPKGWVEDPKYYTAIADVNYREESGKEGLAKLSPAFILLSVVSNKGEYQSFTVSRYGLEVNQQEPIRTQLDTNLQIQKVLFPSTQEIDRRFYLNEEGNMVAQVVYTKDDPAGQLGKLMIIKRITDTKDGSRWDIQYITEETNFNKYKETCEQILNSFSLKKPVDWQKYGFFAMIGIAVISWIITIILKPSGAVTNVDLHPVLKEVKKPVKKRKRTR